MPKSQTVEGFSHYQPSNAETPSIRAGVIKADPTRGLYSFDLPSNWRPQKMSNVLTGNFCMPRCDEPWTECIFADPAEGSVKVVVSPLRRLTNRASVAISDVGPPAAIISSLGSFVTGNQPPEEEEVVRSSREEGVSGPVYTYEVKENERSGERNGERREREMEREKRETATKKKDRKERKKRAHLVEKRKNFKQINAPYGLTGPHHLVAVTTRADLAYIFVVSASEKQWAKSKATLEKVAGSFQA